MAMMLVLPGTFCFAQGTTSVLSGIVFDPQGRVVPNATVTVVSDDKGIKWTAKTNEAGIWRVNALVAGSYHFNVSAPGFESDAYPSFTLEMGTQKNLDTTLKLGESTERITVTAEEPLIDTTGAVSGLVLEAKHLDELPTHTNSPIEFLTTTPGFSFGSYYQASAALSTMLWSNQSMSAGSMNGAGNSTFAVNYTIDGATDTNTSGQVAWVPPMDSIQEVRVTVNAYDASISRTASATVNMMMKSGGLDFHGNLYEFSKNNFWNANTVANDANIFKLKSTVDMATLWKTYHVPIVRHNEYGGMVGGPVWIPKVWDGKKRGTFFFVAWEGLRNNSPYQQPNTVSLPTAAERTGNFSQSFVQKKVGTSTTLTTYANAIYDPTNYVQSGTTVTRAQFAGNVIPTTRISGIAKAILALIPTNIDPTCQNTSANCSSNIANNYANTEDTQINKFNSASIRIDQAWNNNHHSYAEFRRNNINQLSNTLLGVGNPLVSSILVRTNYGLTINHAWVLSPNLLVNITANATIYKSTGDSLADGLDPTKYGYSSKLAAVAVAKGLPTLQSCVNNSDNGGMFAWTLGGSGSTCGHGVALGGSGNSYSRSYEYEGRGYLQQIWKNHVVHYGAEWILQQLAGGDNNNGAGTFYFGGTNGALWTNQSNTVTPGTSEGNVLADFLLGLPGSGYLSNDARTNFSQPYFGVYVQDDWRVTPKLTLNFGLRYDYQLALKERHNQYWSRFDPNYNLTNITSSVQSNYATNIAGGSSSNTGIALLQNLQPASNVYAKGAIQYAGLNGTPDEAFETQPNYVQPRIGFAYQIRPTTVLRGGFGRFVQASFNTGNTSTLGYSSTTNFDASDNNYITPSATLDNPYPNGLQAKTGNSSGVYTNPGSISSFYDPNYKRVYTDDFSLRVEHEYKDYLVEVGGLINHTVGLPEAININLPSTAAWHAAYDPYFDSTQNGGRPAYTLPGYTQVPNPFNGNTYLQSSSSLRTNSTISAYSLLRPSALANNGGDLTEYEYVGKSTHYGLQAKATRRYKNGLGITYGFNWTKQMDATGFNTPAAYSQKMNRQLSSGDMRFTHVLTMTYDLPVGKGKLLLPKSNRLVDGFAGGWSISPVLTLYSGTPLGLPKNSAFFEGGNVSLGSKRTNTKWFDTSKFVPFPNSKSITTAQLWNTSNYPSWTGVSALPGYGYVPDATDAAAGVKNGVFNDFNTWIRNNPPYDNNVRGPRLDSWDASAHKTVHVNEQMRLEFSFIAMNVLNHPMYGILSTSASSSCFGQLSNWQNTCGATPSVSNYPRQIEMSGKFYF
jgi:hypothetical protein